MWDKYNNSDNPDKGRRFPVSPSSITSRVGKMGKENRTRGSDTILVRQPGRLRVPHLLLKCDLTNEMSKYDIVENISRATLVLARRDRQ